MIAINFTNPPSAIPGEIDQSQVFARILSQFPGFPLYIYHNPDQPGSSGEGMGYPYDIYGPTWKAGCNLAIAAKSVLCPRIGGCRTHDLPARDGPIDTLMKKFRPSPIILCDYASGQDAQAESDRYQKIIHANNMIFAPEANSKRAWISPNSSTYIVGEWFHWDHPVANAESDWSSKKWRISEVIASGGKVIVEIISSMRNDLGYTSGIADWPAQQVILAEQFHKIDPANVIASVRCSKMTPAQISHLRSLNT